MKKKDISIHEIRYNLVGKTDALIKVQATYYDGHTEEFYGESMKDVQKIARESLRKRLNGEA